ncbi:helix-turn-helix domain-containing protein [Nitratireductor indicus]|uniref:helix-turn-helix domain-containing protein n=1 Tax=Nitratireductor indicus TaxID=721133 RepID=UPI00287464C8|nr:helix-turn-helix domain-containing protein [Nitratireductor indicus]MDS1135996.1 helix-turn-helix domain-containing protein [Nitratireductor indicus]
MKSNSRENTSSAEILVSTDMVEDEFKNEFWREATRPFYETVPLVGNENRQLEGTIRSRQAAGLIFGSVTFNAQRYNRNRRIIAWSGLDQYLIAVITAGDMAGDFAGTNVTARTGDICVLDLAQVLQSQVNAGGTFSALIPRQTLAKATGHTNLHGLVLKAHQPMTKLLTAYLEGVSDFGEQLSDDEGAAVQEAMITILAAALRGEQPDDAGEIQPLNRALRQRALDFIDGNMNNPDLSPDFILRRFNVSRAHLYRMFAQDGGIANVIRDRRLDAAFIELTRTGLAPRSIAEIAFTLGFTNAAHFSRRFRERFDLTPSEARQEGAFRCLAPELQAHFRKFRITASDPANSSPETHDI